VARTRERYTTVHELLQAGESLHAVSRAVSLSRPTVRRFARAASAGELLDGATGKEWKLDPFKPYIHQRWNEGATDAAALHAELQEHGFTGSVRTVRRYVAPFRQAATAPDPAPAVPKTRQITRRLLSRPEHLQPQEQAQLSAIRASCPHIDALAGHVASFAEMMTGRTGDRDLQAWLAAAEADDSQPDLRSFATGIRQDLQAVTNGLTLPYSSGKVEGTVNKISNARCTGAPDSPCSARASSFTLRNHTIRGRTVPDVP
jgi:transposase